MSTVQGHRAYVITTTDQAGVVVIVAGLWVAWTVISFVTRMYTRIAITGPLSIDDLLSGIGSVSARPSGSSRSLCYSVWRLMSSTAFPTGIRRNSVCPARRSCSAWLWNIWILADTDKNKRR
jgi:hypothetical protein